MKVKVDNRVYDGAQQPVMVILTPQDKANIVNMHPQATAYCVFPQGMAQPDVERFMREAEQPIDLQQCLLGLPYADWVQVIAAAYKEAIKHGPESHLFKMCDNLMRQAQNWAKGRYDIIQPGVPKQ